MGFFRGSCRLAAFVLGVLGAASWASAGSTIAGQLFTPIGTNSALANGDYVSNNLPAPGLNTFLSFYIEVPPGTAQLVVELFDADIGAGPTNDFQIGGAFNTTVNYSLRNPAGAIVAQAVIGPGACAGCDNTWVGFPAQNTPTPGHWELRVDMSAAVTAGDDLNGLGVRAHDGVAGAGGTELNVYAESYTILGVLGAGNALTYQHHPYSTSGCVQDSNDFDTDLAGNFLFTSRSGSFTQSFAAPPLSGSTVWANNPMTGWTTDFSAVDYGIWRADLTLNTPAGQAGNISTFYMGAFNAANPPNGGAGPPPTTQPEANTLRIYLPTDGGTAPLKPFVEQILTHASGPNPPAVGSTSIISVTVRVTNPTPNPITFSSPSNVVTANVPGGAVLYVGASAAVTQGTVTQPAGGAGGNVVWNPGVVAAGQMEVLNYQVAVTPTLPGQRIPVTGTPALNGTTARFVDGTGNTTQARATFTFGPLCDLAVTESTLTYAILSSFTARDDGGRVVVQWETSSEAATAGFILYRYDWEENRWKRVTRRLVPGLQAPQGGSYEVVDETADLDTGLSYALIEVEANRRRRVLGPFYVELDETDAAATPLLAAPIRRLARKPRSRRLPEVRHDRGSKHTRFPRSHRKKLYLATTGPGIYYVAASEIARALGVAEKNVRRRIASGRLVLEHRGKTLRWLAEPSRSGLTFYGEAIESPYTDRNVYALSFGRGHVMTRVSGETDETEESSFFTETISREENRFAGTVVPVDPDGDFWYWEYISSGDPSFGTRSFDVPAPGLDPGMHDAELTVHLQGATDSGVSGEHHVLVSVNGYSVGELQWTGRIRTSKTFDVPQQFLQPSNTVELTGILDEGVPFSILYVDGFELSYQKRYVASGPELAFGGERYPVLTVDGFTDPTIRVLDVSDPLAPQVVDGGKIEKTPTGYRIRFAATSPGARYVAATPSGVHHPVALWPAASTPRRKARRGVEHLVIAPAALEEGADALVAYRRQHGLTSRLVLLQDIMDEYNDGIFDPHAIRDFLASAVETWVVPPRYVVLLGQGNFDYKNTQGLGQNLMPPLMVRTDEGIFASDSRFADVRGDDGIPELAVGRLPVLDSQEVLDYVEKLRVFESAPSDVFQGHVLMLADNPDGGTDFGRDSDRVARELSPGYFTTRIHLADYPVETARALLIDAVNQGTAHINYMGHGGLDRLSSQSLVSAAELEQMMNTERLPVVTAMTCSIGRFGIPGFESLAEEWVKRPGSGAIAVWSSVGLSEHSQALVLNERFFRARFSDPPPRLGDATRKALEDAASLGVPRFMLDIYQLFGDPALEIHAPPSPSTSSDGGSLF